MASQTNEQALEASIEKFLTGTSLEEQRSVQEAVPFSQHHGYRLGQASDFNARYAVDTRFLWQFLEATQIEELARLKERYDNWQTRILDRFDKLAKKIRNSTSPQAGAGYRRCALPSDVSGALSQQFRQG